jgi:hypothetical protein
VKRQTVGYIAIDAEISLNFFRQLRRKPIGVSRSRLIAGIPSRCWTGCAVDLEDGSADRILADADQLRSDLDAEFENLLRRAG